MATSLSHSDLDACSRALRELYAETSLEAFPDRLLPLLAALVPSGHISYNDFDPVQNRFVIRYHPERPDARKLVSQFAAFYETHPLHKATDGVPKRISDVATFRQFSETAIYQEYYRPIGTRHQIICFFDRRKNSFAADSFVGLALNRENKDFSERDLAVLEFLSPHITQAWRNACVAGALAVNLETVGEGLDSMRRAVILAGADGRIYWQSPLAREWLREFFPEERTAEQLPHLLSNWLKRMEKSAAAGRPAFSEFQPPAREDCRLVVYCGKARSGGYVLALLRERTRLDVAATQAFGLTPREAEILYWISEAKTRPEMGAILGVSWRTIAKHMEHIFEKLGVENRLEAQRVGLELRRM